MMKKRLLFGCTIRKLHPKNGDNPFVITCKITESPSPFYNTILPIHCIIPSKYRILFNEVIHIVFIDFYNTRIDRVRQGVASCLNVVFGKGIDIVNHVK